MDRLISADRPQGGSNAVPVTADGIKPSPSDPATWTGNRIIPPGATTSGVMTDVEKAVLDGLAAAWNAFSALDDHHPDDLDEFRRAIHAAQNIVACRVARRVDPHLWWK